MALGAPAVASIASSAPVNQTLGSQSQELAADTWDQWLSEDEGAVEFATNFRDRATELLPSLALALNEWETAGSSRISSWVLPKRLVKVFFLGPKFEEVLAEVEALPRARRLFATLGLPGYGALIDSQFVFRLSESHRLEKAAQVVEESLRVFGDNIFCEAFLTAVLTDVRIGQERWAEADLLLDEATRMLRGEAHPEGEFIAFEARCRIHGARVQLETILGRSDKAWRASEAELHAAQEYVECFGDGYLGSLAKETFFDARDRATDHEYHAGNYADQAQRLELELEGNVHGYTGRKLAVLRYHHARALSAIERHDLSVEPRARDAFRLAIATGELSDLDLLNIEFSLTHLDFAQDDLGAVPARLERIEELLEGIGRGPSSGKQSRDLALLQVFRAAYARESDAPREELLEHIGLLESALEGMIATWRRTPITPGGVGYLRDNRRRFVLGEHIQLCNAVGDMGRALRQALSMQAQGSLTRGSGAEVPSLEVVQQELVGGGGLLVFVPTPTLTHLLIVDATGVAHESLAGGHGLCKLSRELEFASLMGAAGDSLELERVAELLGAALLPASVRKRLESWDHVYFVGTDSLENPRLELVPFGDSVLGCEMAMAYLPSIPLAAHLSRGRPAPTPVDSSSLVLFAGPPVGGTAAGRWPHLADITLGEEMWKELGGALAEDGTQFFVGSRASRQALLGSSLGLARVLHIFSHGVFDGERDPPAGLLLSESDFDTGLVWWDDIADLDVPELVVLAACGGGRGRARFGEDGISHLGGAFLSAGARTILLARSEIEVAATFDAMQTFHSELASGESPMEALLIARQRTRDGRGTTSLLSSLFLLGPAHQPLFLPLESPGRNLYGAGLALALALSWLLLSRRRRKQT